MSGVGFLATGLPELVESGIGRGVLPTALVGGTGGGVIGFCVHQPWSAVERDAPSSASTPSPSSALSSV